MVDSNPDPATASARVQVSDPDHDDEFMDGVAQAVALKRLGSVVAREGLVLRP